MSDTEQSVVARSKSGKHGEIHASCGGVKCLRTARAVDLHGSVKNPERSNLRRVRDATRRAKRNLRAAWRIKCRRRSNPKAARGSEVSSTEQSVSGTAQGDGSGAIRKRGGA